MYERRPHQFVGSQSYLLMVEFSPHLDLGGPRLADIDAPEKDQPHGRVATMMLRGLIEGRLVEVDEVARDVYRRAVGKVTLDGQSINQMMKKSINQLRQNAFRPKEAYGAISHDVSTSIKLSDEVGNGRANQPNDIIWLKHAMHCLGRYNDHLERHGYIDRALQAAIDGFQRDRGLRQDGWMAPGGPTEQTVRRHLRHLDEE